MNLFGSEYTSWTQGQKEAYFKWRIIKYLPTFVRVGSVTFDAVITAIAKSFVRYYDFVYDFQNRFYTGKSLRLHADRKRVFHRLEETDGNIQTFIAQHIEKLTKRGTEGGIADDLGNIEDVNYALPEFYGGQTTGWILDVNYPEIEVPKVNFLDSYKVLKLNLQLKNSLGYALLDEARLGYHINDEIKTKTEGRKLVDNEVVPVNLDVIYE